jgi:hypothetical protein
LKRTGSILGGRRAPRRRHESGLGRFTRGAIEFLLVLVVLLFIASWAGLLGPRQGATPSAAADGAVGETNVVRALATQSAAGARGNGLGSRSHPTPDAEPAASIRVHLANGSGVAKLAAGLRVPLRRAGFDVCGTANADCCDYQETIVIDRCGERWKAEAVCQYLRAQWGAGRVVLQARTSLESDVLVILGRDLAQAWAQTSVDAQ